MTSSRILSYDNATKSIKYYYEDHKTKERIEVNEHIFDFMKKLVMHIPESQFKMIRYYGLYATSTHNHKAKVKLMLSQDTSKRVVKKVSYRKDLIAIFNTDPFLCECGSYMIFVDAYIPSSIGGEMNGPLS